MKNSRKLEILSIVIIFFVVNLMVSLFEIKTYAIWFIILILGYRQIFVNALYLKQKNRWFPPLKQEYQKYVCSFFLPFSIIFFIFGSLQINGKFENPFFMFYLHRYYQDPNVVASWIVIFLWSIYYLWWLFFNRGFKNLEYIDQINNEDNNRKNSNKKENFISSFVILLTPLFLVIICFFIDLLMPYFQNLQR